MGEPTLYLFHENAPLRLPTGQSHRVRLIAPQLQSDLPLRQLEGVAATFERAAFVVWMRKLFGHDVPLGAYQSLHAELRAGSVSMPPITLASTLPQGRLAAYDSEQRRIIVSHVIVQEAVAEAGTAARWQLVAVLIEEFGHHIDWLLRNHYSSVRGDAPRDEGAMFAYAILNLDWSARAGAPIADLRYPFGTRSLDVEWITYREKIKPWVDARQQSDVDQASHYEFFGAGLGKGDAQNTQRSYGHERIEIVLLNMKSGFQGKDVVKQIYFGNWLRDMSQAVVPQTLKCLSREALTQILDVKARARFGDEAIFRNHAGDPRCVSRRRASRQSVRPRRWNRRRL